MSSQPLDEDGFHSIAWDDAPSVPAKGNGSTSHQPSSGFSVSSESDNGFETISAASPGSPSRSGFASTGTANQHARHKSEIEAMREHAEVDGSEWGGRWMVIEVKDPVKEHEGSKDMFVSYAVRTRVRALSGGTDGLDKCRQLCPICRGCETPFPGLCVLKGTPSQGVPGEYRTTDSGQAPLGYVAKLWPGTVLIWIEYIKGDRFSSDFIEKRRLE
jgi:sorting nexin-4